MVNRVSERDRRSRDFSLNELRKAVREVIACFPVYRTYVRPDRPVAERDRGYIQQAVARARRRNPNIDETVFAFVQEALLLQHPEGVATSDRAQREAFVARFQQTTGRSRPRGWKTPPSTASSSSPPSTRSAATPQRFGWSPSASTR